MVTSIESAIAPNVPTNLPAALDVLKRLAVAEADGDMFAIAGDIEPLLTARAAFALALEELPALHTDFEESVSDFAQFTRNTLRRIEDSEPVAAPVATPPMRSSLWYARGSSDDSLDGEKTLDRIAGTVLQEFADLRYRLDAADHKRALGSHCFSEVELERASFDALQTRAAIDALRPLYLALCYGQTIAWWNSNRDKLRPYIERCNSEPGHVKINLDDVMGGFAIYRD